MSSLRYDVSLGWRLARAVPVVLLYGSVAALCIALLPQSAWHESFGSFAAIGVVGIWRYGWLLTHCVRALIYEHYVYSRWQHAASQLPPDRKYPRRLIFVIPTFGEKPEVSRRMLTSVLDESSTIPSRVTVYINAGSDEEDAVFRETHARHPRASAAEVVYIRQRGGKRQGMADVLRAVAELELGEQDAVVLMDGDTVLGRNILRKCLPLFALHPKLAALTTDNISVTTGHWLYRRWYTLRFAMRHRYMKSQSLSRQLLVLTGRFSIFRANWCVRDDFIGALENDRIRHWLHGEIKFVTGDDKSTWYTLLRHGCEMVYVPDAHIFCMEDSTDRPFMTSVRKMHRWFGNMLRNNGRAIRLGLAPQKAFIWWCHIDQRLSIWTSLLGPACALWAAWWISPYYLLLYAALVIIVRSAYVVLLAIEGHRPSLTDIPLLLYTQWGGSLVKTYTLFHLHRQKWDAHRESADRRRSTARDPWPVFLIPKMQMVLSFSVLLLIIALMVGVR